MSEKVAGWTQSVVSALPTQQRADQYTVLHVNHLLLCIVTLYRYIIVTNRLYNERFNISLCVIDYILNAGLFTCNEIFYTVVYLL